MVEKKPGVYAPILPFLRALLMLRGIDVGNPSGLLFLDGFRRLSPVLAVQVSQIQMS